MQNAHRFPKPNNPQVESIAVIEKDLATGLLVGYIPGYVGAHSQGETIDELMKNLREVLSLILEDSTLPKPESEFVGTQVVTV